METALPRISVIVVSHGRPDHLALCLTGVSRLLYSDYEVIVVADRAGFARVAELPFAGDLTCLPFDTANISKARNLGLEQAAGEIVAFLDDDAVPEPMWLAHLARAFRDFDIAAATGYVRGRNGISFQWKASEIDSAGQRHDLPDKAAPWVPDPSAPDRAIKTEGTNMAFRLDILRGLGGFDPAYPYFLDESDVNMRLSQAGLATAIVPVAEVHHGFALSRNRNADRAVRDLSVIAASFAVFLRKHLRQADHPRAVSRFRAEQRRRLIAQMIDGRLEPRDVRRVMAGFETGLADGMLRDVRPLSPLERAERGFKPFPSRATGQHRVLSGSLFKRRSLKAEAARLSREGETVSLFLVAPGFLYHRVKFTEDGYWLQFGGRMGRSDRSKRVRPLGITRAARVDREIHRVSAARGLPE